MLIYTLIATTLGLILNMLVGKPGLFIGFERIIKATAKHMESFLKKNYQETPEAQAMAGFAMVFFMLLIFAGIPLVLIILAYVFAPIAGVLLESLLLWFSLNIKNTRVNAYRIMRYARAGKLEEAQKRLSYITGKDCSDMSMDEVIKTAVEKVSDRCLDGGFAPIFYMSILGGFGAVFYKIICIINEEITKNKEEYIDFGKGTRKLRRILGFVPSRIGAALIKFDVKILALDKNNARKIHKRDSKNASPEFLGQARAVIAGALDIQLNSEDYYDGVIIRPRCIGDPVKPCDANDIYWANQLFYGSVFLFFGLFSLIKLLLFLIF